MSQLQYVHTDNHNTVYPLLDKVRVAIKFPTMLQASSPSKNAGNGVGAGRPTLRVEKEMEICLELPI